MSDLSSAIEKYNKFIDIPSIGINAAQAALNALYPNDFEYYMMAFELVDPTDKTIDYFVFPIMPSAFSDNIVSPTTVTNTMGGVSVTSNSSFSPHDVMMQGNFGRKFKILTGGGQDSIHPAVAMYSTSSGAFDQAAFIPSMRGKFIKALSNTRVKTGYGAFKILEGICAKSKADLNGKPNRLYMYNPALGANYMVKVMNFKASMSGANNMIWGYELTLKAVAPLEAIVGIGKKKDSLAGALTSSVVQNTANKVATASLKLL